MPFSQYGANNGGSNGNNRDAPEDRPEPQNGMDFHTRLYWTDYTVIEGRVGEAVVLDNEWAQEIMWYLDNTQVLEGVLYDRDQSDEDPRSNKVKLFNFDDVGYGVDEFVDGRVEPSEVTNRHTEKHFGDTYKFHYMGLRVAGDDEHDAIEYEVEDGNLDLETIQLKFSTTSSDERNGPTAKAKRFVRLMAENGVQALEDEDSDHGWVSDDMEIAEELHGRRVRIWTEKDSYQGNPYSLLQVQDAETGEFLPVRGTNFEDADDTPWDEDEDDEVADETEDGDEDDDSVNIREEYSSDVVGVLEWCSNNCTDVAEVREAIEKSEGTAFDDELESEEKEMLAQAVASGDFQ